MKFNVRKLKIAIDKWSMHMGAEDIHVQIPDNDKKKRDHLGLSVLGHDCQRAVFYSHRKVGRPTPPPNVMRLFQRGHREEFFFAHMLRAVGIKIWDTDPKTGKQFKIEDFDGHLGGSLDSVGKDPGLLYAKKKKPFLIEYKTYNLDRFKKLVKSGVKESDPKYYTQTQGYLGYEPRLAGSLFCAICKNDDNIHIEWNRPDPVIFEMIKERAELVLNATSPPKGISQRKSHWKCKLCDFKDRCFKDRLPSVQSCRSCANGVPASGGGGQWECLAGHNFGEVCEDYEDCNR